MDRRTADVDDERARFQFNLFPKWLDFAGLPRAFGRREALHKVYRAIMVSDHSTDGLKSRRHGEDNRVFACPNEDIAQLAGVDVKTVGRCAKRLVELGLLVHYEPGSGRTWSRFEVNRAPVLELYLFVAPQLRKIHGGIQNVEEGPDAGKALAQTQIYGVQNDIPPAPLIVDEIQMLKLWRDRPVEPVWPDPLHVAKILGIEG